MVLPAGIQTTFHMIHIMTSYHDAKDGVYLVKEKNDNKHYGNHKGRTGYTLVFYFYFPTNGSTNPDIF